MFLSSDISLAPFRMYQSVLLSLLYCIYFSDLSASSLSEKNHRECNLRDFEKETLNILPSAMQPYRTDLTHSCVLRNYIATKSFCKG